MDQPRYRAFISYSHGDLKVAQWLHRAIETYRPPKSVVGTMTQYGPVPARMGKVFRDEEELAGAAELGGELEDALRASDALIVICSPRAAKSRWVGHEIRFFKHVNPTRPVLAVIAEGAPGGENNCFPEPLLHGVTPSGDIDRTVVIEPLAPDLQKLDNSAVKLKLIAGLLGVGYDDLARRELRRARQLTAVVAGASAVIIFLLSGLAIAAVLGQREAVRQRKVAEANLALAQKQQWLAEAARDAVMAQLDVVTADGKDKKVKARDKSAP